MDITNQLLFFFSGLGVFNGLFMSLYFLLVLRPRRLQNQLFGLLILMLTIRIGKSVFYYFLEDLPKVESVDRAGDLCNMGNLYHRIGSSIEAFID